MKTAKTISGLLLSTFCAFTLISPLGHAANSPIERELSSCPSLSSLSLGNTSSSTVEQEVCSSTTALPCEHFSFEDQVRQEWTERRHAFNVEKEEHGQTLGITPAFEKEQQANRAKSRVARETAKAERIKAQKRTAEGKQARNLWTVEWQCKLDCLDKGLHKKVHELIRDIREEGTLGKPELLKHYNPQGAISRRISDGDRLVYVLDQTNKKIHIYECVGHYKQ